MSLQSDIANAVRARGYRDGYDDHAFAARQILKAIEELSEAAYHIRWPSNLTHIATDLSRLAAQARIAFDNRDSCEWALLEDFEAFALEIADAVVVLANAGDAAGRDVFELARTKAIKDVERGVR